MQSYQGKSVYKGIAMGPVVVLKKNDYQVKRTRIEDPEAEIKRVDEALEKSKEQLQKLYDKAVQEVGEASAAIFEVHQMMLEDDDYLEAIQNTIRTEQINAEYAVAATGDNFAEMFASMDDDYMKARSADIKDISERLVRNLSGQDDADLSSIEPSIIVADDLSPSETVQMDKDKILAFVTVHGSTNSHTAILARMMNIPALIGVDMNLEEIHTGMEAVVDGFQGTVIFEPDETVKAQTTEKMAEEAEKLRLLQELKGKENVTLDGHKINIYANIGSVGDIGYVMENDEAGFYTRLGFAYIDESVLTVEYKFTYTSGGGFAQRSFTIPMTEETIVELVNMLENKLTAKAFAKEQRTLMTKKLRDYIKNRDNFTCCNCGNSTFKEPNLLLEIDHIIPVAKGGLTEESNLQTLCWKCNRSKSDKIM